MAKSLWKVCLNVQEPKQITNIHVRHTGQNICVSSAPHDPLISLALLVCNWVKPKRSKSYFILYLGLC